MYVSEWTVGFVLGLVTGAGGLLTLGALLMQRGKGRK